MTRRMIWAGWLCLVSTGAGGALAGEQPATAKQGLERLRQGNTAYQAERIDVSGFAVARRAEVAKSQHPFATVLTCSDSRVQAEMIFNQGLGDLFVVRTAGAVADRVVLGSIEYAAEHLHVPLLVVMGHTSCGAVKAAMDTPVPAKPDPAGVNLERILSAIRPSLEHAAPTGDRWVNSVCASVDQNLDDIVRLSPVLSELGESRKVLFVGAVHELDSGKVNFSDRTAFRSQHSGNRAPVVSVRPERHY